MPKISPISHKKFIKFLKKVGCEYQRSSGSHMIYDKEGINRCVVVPVHPKDLPVHVIMSCLNTLKISREEFLKIIQEI